VRCSSCLERKKPTKISSRLLPCTDTSIKKTKRNWLGPAGSRLARKLLYTHRLLPWPPSLFRFPVQSPLWHRRLGGFEWINGGGDHDSLISKKLLSNLQQSVQSSSIYSSRFVCSCSSLPIWFDLFSTSLSLFPNPHVLDPWARQKVEDMWSANISES
jgi:hypothetical protein